MTLLSDMYRKYYMFLSYHLYFVIMRHRMLMCYIPIHNAHWELIIASELDHIRQSKALFEFCDTVPG